MACNPHNRRSVVRLIGFFIVLLSEYPSPTLAQDTRFQTLDSVLASQHRQQRFNGVVLVAENGKVRYKRAFGVANIHTDEPLTPRSVFNLASVAKQFVATAVMMLAEKGQLRYDDKVARYLSGFPYPDLTLRHLLTHTSGLPEYVDLWRDHFPPATLFSNEALLQLLKKHKPKTHFRPGERFEYCNTGYLVLTSVVENLSGQKMADLLRRRIFAPLGMKDSYVYHLGMPAPPNRVLGFRRQNGKRVPDDLTENLDGVVGDGNVYASAEDLLKWDQALYTEKLIKPATRQEAFTPVRLNDGSIYPYGFGWLLGSGQSVEHTGEWGGFRTWIRRDMGPRNTVIVLDNSGNRTMEPLLLAVYSILRNQPFQLPVSTLITGVQLVDGTGAPARPAAVRLQGERIAEVGALKALPGETVVDGGGLTLAPGFIDTHSHHDGGLREQPTVLAAISQGVTTIVVGQDGGSPYPLKDFFARLDSVPAAVNVASYAGHNTLRQRAMGKGYQRLATGEEMRQMKEMLAGELAAGALGLSTGLEYDPGIYSNHDEVLQLAKEAAKVHGRYISHLRSEDVDLEQAVEEIIHIGRVAGLPVQISHFKVGMKGKWGMAPQLLARLQQARSEGVAITADVYPYDYWQSSLTVLFPKRDFTNRASAEFVLRELAPADGMILARYGPNPAYVGKSIATIAKERNEDAPTTYMKLIADARAKGAEESVLARAMSEEDIATLLAWSHTNVCSDGGITGHPRGRGAFPRVLGHYVRERKVLSLEGAIHKMTALAAEHTGIRERGTVTPGHYADLVLFNPATVRDNATLQHPQALASGIERVWVNGQVVYQNQQVTGQTPGKAIRRSMINDQ